MYALGTPGWESWRLGGGLLRDVAGVMAGRVVAGDGWRGRVCPVVLIPAGIAALLPR